MKLLHKEGNSKDINTTTLRPITEFKRLEDEDFLPIPSAIDVSTTKDYSSDPEIDDEDIDFEVASIFSRATIDSGTYTSSISLLVKGAEDGFLAILIEDDILMPMYKTVAVKLKLEQFKRNFARLLSMYANGLQKGAVDSLQKAAIGLVRSRRKAIANAIR